MLTTSLQKKIINDKTGKKIKVIDKTENVFKVIDKTCVYQCLKLCTVKALLLEVKNAPKISIIFFDN